MQRIMVLLIIWSGLTGCSFDRGHEAVKTESHSIDLGNAELVRLEVKMGAGVLAMKGGAQKLMESEFRFSPPSWKPEVRYDMSSFRGRLTVQQPSSSGGRHSTNEWNLRFNNGVPMDVFVTLGAGEGRLELGDMSLRGVEIEMGAGELRLDLRGKPKRSYEASVRGGVGEANIYLPKDVGVIADVKGGLGGISTRGMHKQDGSYVNDAYQESKTAIRLDVKGGVGAINLYCE
jgi:hypothetical protein